jgi:hypothetical protein
LHCDVSSPLNDLLLSPWPRSSIPGDRWEKDYGSYLTASPLFMIYITQEM